jgi:hypothetical protein
MPFEQLALTVTQGGMLRYARFQSSQRALHANELGSSLITQLVEPVGVAESRAVGIGIGGDGRQEWGVFGHAKQHVV